MDTQGTRSRLRLARAEDAAAIARVYAPNVAESVISFEMTPPTADEIGKRLKEIEAIAPWLVCEVEGVVVGYAYASRHHERAAYQWSLNGAVYIAAEHQRTGIGRALYTTLFALVSLQGYYCVHAGITLPNAASVGLHESLGFRKVALYPAVGYKLGAWRDVGWWQLELRPRLEEPAPLRALEVVERQQPTEWAQAFAAGQQLLR